MTRRIVLTALGAWLLLAEMWWPHSSNQLWAETQPELKLKVGDAAPDFKMKYFDGSSLKDVSLSEYRGKKNVVVAFYIFAFTGG